jgi:hypothetical protein
MPVTAACPTETVPGVHVESDTDAAVTLLAVCGTWDSQLWTATTAAVRRCLADQPEALIVDLSGLDDPRTLSASTWVAARRAAADAEPPVQLALCVPPELPLADRMQRLGDGRCLPIYAKVRQARVAIAGRLPVAQRVSVTLLPEPEAPSLARNLVADACLAWQMVELLHAARLVMSELVTNAVEHAHTPMTVVVTRRGSGLHISVADEVAQAPRVIRLARPRRGQPLDERGRGLLTVSETATAWGWLPTRSGKVVWATLQPAREEQPPSVPRRRHPNAPPTALR